MITTNKKPIAYFLIGLIAGVTSMICINMIISNSDNNEVINEIRMLNELINEQLKSLYKQNNVSLDELFDINNISQETLSNTEAIIDKLKADKVYEQEYEKNKEVIKPNNNRLYNERLPIAHELSNANIDYQLLKIINKHNINKSEPRIRALLLNTTNELKTVDGECYIESKKIIKKYDNIKDKDDYDNQIMTMEIKNNQNNYNNKREVIIAEFCEKLSEILGLNNR